MRVIVFLFTESVMYSTDENELRQNIKTLEEQVKYLTSLLNESEKSSARNEQQIALFKEEIRRLQRMFEREPHLQNTEYLKNIVLKVILNLKYTNLYIVVN